MTDQNPNTTPPSQEEPFIPPQYMLYLALAGLLVALFIAFTQPDGTQNVVFWGGLGFAVLSIIAWALLAPQQLKDFLTGRTLRFGGTSLIVTIIFLVALIAIYTFVKGRDLRLDLTERNNFSLTDQARTAIAGIGADPTLPEVKLLAFYGPSQASRRDQDSVLFDDYVTTSNSKITYEFVDPDRNPTLATRYEARNGQIAVVPLNDAGEEDVENAELVTSAVQDQLTNAILRVAASGDFRAYFLNVDGAREIDDTSPTGFSTLNDALVQQYDWQTQQVSIFELTAPDSEIDLQDPNADGIVMIIPGGTRPLADAEMEFIANYVDDGGNLIVFADNSLNDDGESLATGQNLSDYLYNNFGMRFQNDIVNDPSLALQPFVPVAVDFGADNYITQNFSSNQQGMIFELPHSIEMAPTVPENVVVSELARTSAESYAKTDFQSVLDGNFDKLETDPQGPFVLAAAAENTDTGARVVLFGSPSIASNGYVLANNVVNLDAAFNSLIWTTHFDEFFGTVTIQSDTNPQDQPIFADEQTLRNANFVTIILLPFGVLAIGLLVWWNSREREHTQASR